MLSNIEDNIDSEISASLATATYSIRLIVSFYILTDALRWHNIAIVSTTPSNQRRSNKGNCSSRHGSHGRRLIGRQASSSSSSSGEDRRRKGLASHRLLICNAVLKTSFGDSSTEAIESNNGISAVKHQLRLGTMIVVSIKGYGLLLLMVVFSYGCGS